LSKYSILALKTEYKNSIFVALQVVEFHGIGVHGKGLTTKSSWEQFRVARSKYVDPRF